METKSPEQSDFVTSRKTLRTFGRASFLNDLGAECVFSLWPLYLTSVLGANMTILGLIDGIGEAVVSIAQAVAGYIADRTGKRKIFIWLGYLTAGIARIGYALAPTWHTIIPFRILDRTGKMRGSPRDAIIADLSTDGNRGSHFGYLRMMDNLGAVCGILTATLLFSHLGYTNIFILAAIPSFMGSWLIYRTVKERPRDGAPLFKGFHLKNFSRDLKLYTFLSAIFALSTFSYSFLLIYAKEYNFPLIAIPLVYLAYNLIASIVSIPFGKLADRVKRKPVLIASFILWLLVCLALLIFRSPVGVVIAFVLYGLHLGALDPVQRALVSELATPDMRASSLGGFQMVIGFAALPSSLIAGLLWDQVSLTAPLQFSASLAFAALILLLFVREHLPAKAINKLVT